MEITISVPDELAAQLQLIETEVPEILHLGMREWTARGALGLLSLAPLLETLASLPTPEEVLALRPSVALQTRLEELLEKNQHTGLSPSEQREWEQYHYLEHLVRMAKARAALKLAGA